MSADLDRLTRRLRLHFSDPRLLEIALTHRSAGAQHNERFEFLGDAVLGFIVAQTLFERFPEADEGALSRLRAELVNQESLAECARALDLGESIRLGPGELKSGGFRRDSILSDAFEAVIAAVLLDQGFEACRAWVLERMDQRLRTLSLTRLEKDPKTRLQEYLQARALELPVYTLIGQSGPPHDQTFCVECRTTLWPQPTQGEGSSRKRAEQQAAERMLERLAQSERKTE